MKKPFVAALLLAGAAAIVTNPAFAQVDELGTAELGNKLVNAKMVKELMGSRAKQLRTSAGPDPDTVWFGHSYTDHTGLPGPVVNYWNLYTGVNQPGEALANNAIWDFNHSTGFGAYVGDSLAGWWPYRRAYAITGGLTLADNQRPWWAIDIGNQGNYVIPQGAGGKRTKGVVGYWHHDAGAGQGSGVTWSPISGSKSAWCGLRQHGDNSSIDLITGNPHNQTVLEFNNEGDGGTGTNKRFPGYTRQMDQMLYRDIAITPGQDLAVSFSYRTRMSTGVVTTSATRTGWFAKDPLSVTAGNFISSSAAGANAPIDSFMVYIGAPVDDANVTYSDGSINPVYDPQRRWFSEVLRVNEGSVPFFQVLSTFGAQPADTLSPAMTYSGTLSSSQVNSILTATGVNRLRLVFRVKTNQAFDDADTRLNGFSSFSRGAAIIDDVTVNVGGGGAVVIGDFEGSDQSGVNSIDNRTGASALNNWKSTGKPPAVYMHARPLADIVLEGRYADLCGPPDSPARFCNIAGAVIEAGNADELYAHGNPSILSDRELQHAILSPTINLRTPGVGANEQGLTSTIVDATDDWYTWYDMYAGMFNLFFSGNAWTFAAQSYPATQVGNGARVWGAPRFPGFQIFNPEPQCFQDIEPLFGLGLVLTSNTSGVPDSLRIALGVNQQCFRFAVSAGCNSRDGAYFDNISLGFVDVAASAQTSATNAITLGTMAADIWHFYNDAFPRNETPLLPGTPGFDTTTAILATGINNYPNTGNAQRNDVPGDTAVVTAANATVSSPDDPAYGPVRVDMVFRILPGPGNYQVAAGRNFPPDGSMNLLDVPSNQADVVANGDASFWGQYLADPGPFASPGAHFGGSRWDHLSWNSARMDTSELNFFPVTRRSIGSGLTPGSYATMYHEADPKFGALGILKNKCFLADTATSQANHTGIICKPGDVPATAYPPAWVTSKLVSGVHLTGYDGNIQTREHTKIIPDGLLTPGSHVQYFYRKSHNIDPLLSYVTCPDTFTISPQTRESSTDGHRWQQFGVLPDRWKDGAFDGAGMACLLYVDNNDRRGNERVWMSVMDSIGGIRAEDTGNHNGWGRMSAAADYAGAFIGDDPLVDAALVMNRNKQAGTTFDMYGVKASESLTTQAGAFGSRLATPGIGFALGKDSKQGPTPEMLRTYYRVVALLSGDLNSGILGPFANRSQNDINLLNDFLQTAGGTAQPRGFLASGDGFAQSETQTGGVDPIHTQFLAGRMGLTLRNGSYTAVSGNLNDCVDMLTTNLITTNGDIYGVSNTCLWSNDLLQRNAVGVPEAVEASFYENAGVSGPYAHSVIKPATGLRNWVSMLEGAEIEHVFSRYCENSNGRLAYYYNVFNNVFGSLCTITGSPLVTLDTPGNQDGAVFANFMKVGNNVVRSGNAIVKFGIAKNDRVAVDIYDVSGRMVRRIADRTFLAGEHSLTWDGADDAGNQVARGVYFARVQMAGQAKDMTGRVIVLR